MWHELVGDENLFFSSLIAGDEALAAEVQRRGCPCGGRLDRADYPRKPRGVPAAWDEAFCRRISFCCARPGCRKRNTPPSLRFFGRRVYVAAVMMVVCGRWVTARLAGVPKNTARRWRRFFGGRFVDTAFFRWAQGQWVPPITSDVVASLLARFGPRGGRTLRRALSFLSPCTTSSSPSVRVR